MRRMGHSPVALSTSASALIGSKELRWPNQFRTDASFQTTTKPVSIPDFGGKLGFGSDEEVGRGMSEEGWWSHACWEVER